MATKLFFENKDTHKRYEVLSIDNSTKPPILLLKGEVAKFTQVYDKSLFERLGYALEKVEVEEPAGED